MGAAKAIAKAANFAIHSTIVKGGKSKILQSIPAYNSAAQHQPWFVLIDLDNDFPCGAKARQTWLPQPSSLMCFRIAVREIEAWLLADHDEASKFLGVSKALMPPQPEDVDDPKQLLVNLARRSRKRDIREGLVPRDGSGVNVGPTYASDISNFSETNWRPEVARSLSPSLDKCLKRLEELAQRLAVTP